MKNDKKILKMFRKLVSIIILFIILIYVLNINVVQAVTIKPRIEITDKLSNYPGYTELINKLKEAHPEWNFRILYTGLDWNQVIKSEATHGRNLVSSTRTNAWICSVCGNKAYDNGSWRCASEAAISYFMDPRNSLNETYVFQFEALSYNKDVQTIEGVQQIIKDVKYMQGDKITYTKTDGTIGTIDKSYAQVIMEAAEESNVSPYHIAARIRQEQGTDSPSALASGTYEGFIGYYNYFNIKASGNGNAQIIANGLTYAKNNGFTDPELSIKGGAKFLANNYIGSGQDTLYLQKFDVDDSDGTLYYFQYMQNLSASKSEGTKARESYEKLGMINSKIDFIIPVYENMPETACPEPVDADIVTQNVKITGNSVQIREGKSTTSNVIKKVDKGYELLRIELSSNKENGYYWDKVVLPDGTKGYVVRNYLEKVEDITNCNDSMVVTTSANLRNGPGLTGTTIITTLIKGQLITRIEKGKYNLDGYIWDRVVLADGRQGYIAENYIVFPSEQKDDEQTTSEIIRVICKSGLKVRKEPGTDKIVSTTLANNETLTRIQKEVSNANGYIWDKVVTNNGIEGYIARGDSKEQYIEVVVNQKDENPKDNDTNNENGITETPVVTDKNNNMKIEDSNLICEPKVTIEDIKEKFTETEITVKKSDGTIVESGSVGTGYVINIEDKTYTIVKLGDVNGDGKINSGDSLILSKQVLKKIELSDTNQKIAADVNRDGKINSGDTLIVRKQILNTYKISIVNNEGE